MNYKRKQRGKQINEVVFPLAENLTAMPKNYRSFIENLKNQIRHERLKTVLSANASMVLMYWGIGKSILEQQNTEGWGTKVIDRMSYDLKEEFPDIAGFSPRNLKYMRKFAEEWPNIEIVQRTVAQIPWRSNITLLDKIKEPDLRLWYAQKTIENGFGKDMLVFQIESKLHQREGNAVSNFRNALPPEKSDLATQAFKDPYIFDFVGNSNRIRERE
jgi:predicted nuclease of restriction endonuclease-like (RecB) superfamily